MKSADTLMDEELIHLTFKNMERLRRLSSMKYCEEIRKVKYYLNSLILEVKRRGIKVEEYTVANMILKEY